MSVNNMRESSFIRCVADPTPVTHNILGSIPTKGCFPMPTTGTGTITSTPSTAVGTANKKVVWGTGTLFTSEVRPGDYIYAGDVVREVEFVTSDTQLILRNPLPADVSAVALKVVRSGKYKSVYVINSGSATAVFDEAPLKTGVQSGFERRNEAGLEPVSYDATGAGVQLTFELSE